VEVGLGLALADALGESVGLVDGELEGLGEAEGLATIAGRLGAALVGELGPPPNGAGAVGLVAAKATMRPAVAASASPTGKMAAEERVSTTSPPLFWAERR
jgi:hypothetical protein